MMRLYKIRNFNGVLILIGLALSISANAATRIAVLEFELNDITTLPYKAAETARTATFKPLLEKEINAVGDYEIIQISAKQVTLANAGLGYLYKFHDIAAFLGKQAGAEWIIVSQHSKPSFLYSYLLVNLVHTTTASLVAHYAIELKGNHQKVTQRGVKRLSIEIDKSINKAKPGG